MRRIAFGIGAFVLFCIFVFFSLSAFGVLKVNWNYLLINPLRSPPIAFKKESGLEDILVMSQVKTLSFPFILIRVHRGIPDKKSLTQWQVSGSDKSAVIVSGCTSGSLFGAIKSADIYIDPVLFQNAINPQDTSRLLNIGIARCLWWTINPTISVAEDSDLVEKILENFSRDPIFMLNK